MLTDDLISQTLDKIMKEAGYGEEAFSFKPENGDFLEKVESLKVTESYQLTGWFRPIDLEPGIHIIIDITNVGESFRLTMRDIDTGELWYDKEISLVPVTS